MKTERITNTINFRHGSETQKIQNLINQLGSDIKYPNAQRNYCIFNEKRVNELANYKEKALQPMANYIATSMNMNGIIEGLYVVDKMVDNKTKGVENLYPALSRFNQCQCPHTQTLLAGIYRKTQVPDGFGPLVNMLVKNSITPQYPKPFFNPNEEIGGAILEYIKTYASKGYENK